MVSLLEGDKRGYGLSVFINTKGRQFYISGKPLETDFSPCMYKTCKCKTNFQIQCINCKILFSLSHTNISSQLTSHVVLHSSKKEEKEPHWNRVTMLLGLISWKYYHQVTGIPLTLHLLLKWRTSQWMVRVSTHLHQRSCGEQKDPPPLYYHLHKEEKKGHSCTRLFWREERVQYVGQTLLIGKSAASQEPGWERSLGNFLP